MITATSIATRLRLALTVGAVPLVLAACGGSAATPSTAPTVVETGGTAGPTATPSPTLTASAPLSQGSAAAAGTVSRSQAEQIALDAVGAGGVTWSGPEDDRGAAWEVEITRPDGSEVDVLVAADGRVVKQIEKHGQGPVMEGPGTVPSTGAVTREQAEQAALDAIGEGRVTWSGPEDDRGAAWEVEITRPNGSEVDVLVAPDGSIVN